jgi:hypothetical protein
LFVRFGWNRAKLSPTRRAASLDAEGFGENSPRIPAIAPQIEVYSGV